MAYALLPVSGPEQDVVRWVCDNLGARASKVIGHISHAADTSPIEVLCDTGADLDVDEVDAACPTTASTSRVVLVSTEPGTAADDVLVRRRAS